MFGRKQTRLGILVTKKHFGGTIPARGDVVGHVGVAAGVLDGVERPCKTKVADLCVAVGVHKDVPRFLLRDSIEERRSDVVHLRTVQRERETNEVTMDDTSRVEVEQTAQDLVHKVLHVLISKGLARADDLRQICVHQV